MVCLSDTAEDTDKLTLSEKLMILELPASSLCYIHKQQPGPSDSSDLCFEHARTLHSLCSNPQAVNISAEFRPGDDKYTYAPAVDVDTASLEPFNFRPNPVPGFANPVEHTAIQARFIANASLASLPIINALSSRGLPWEFKSLSEAAEHCQNATGCAAFMFSAWGTIEFKSGFSEADFVKVNSTGEVATVLYVKSSNTQAVMPQPDSSTALLDPERPYTVVANIDSPLDIKCTADGKCNGYQDENGYKRLLEPLVLSPNGNMGVCIGDCITGFADSGFNSTALSPGKHTVAIVSVPAASEHAWKHGLTSFYIDGVAVGTVNANAGGSIEHADSTVAIYPMGMDAAKVFILTAPPIVHNDTELAAAFSLDGIWLKFGTKGQLGQDSGKLGSHAQPQGTVVQTESFNFGHAANIRSNSLLELPDHMKPVEDRYSVSAFFRYPLDGCDWHTLTAGMHDSHLVISPSQQVCVVLDCTAH